MEILTKNVQHAIDDQAVPENYYYYLMDSLLYNPWAFNFLAALCFLARLSQWLIYFIISLSITKI